MTESAAAADIIAKYAADAPSLSPHQQEIIRDVIAISGEFDRSARISPQPGPKPDNPDIVIESGHQPNFLPFTGIIRKVYLLHWITGHLTEQGRHPVAFFGFADQNLSTASYLHENIIPSVNKNGYEKIGFRIRDKDRWKCFNTLEKPSREHWDREMRKFRETYIKNTRTGDPYAKEIHARAEQVIGLLDDCFEYASNFADLNAYFLARLCTEIFGIRVFFFRYSDIQRRAVFAREAEDLVARRMEYISTYNTAVKNTASSLHSLEGDHLPFWHHCWCGGDVPLTCIGTTGVGKCPSCGKQHTIEFGEGFREIGSCLSSMSFTAVARNLVFTRGLGTRFFISGSGGALDYGRISDAVAGSIGFSVPVTLAWTSRDLYLGKTQNEALIDFLRLFKIRKTDLTDSTAAGKIRDHRRFLKESLAACSSSETDKKTLQKYQGLCNNATIQLGIVKNIFSVTPSMLDVVISVSPQIMLDRWKQSVEDGRFTGGPGTWKLQQDSVYATGNTLGVGAGEIPIVYKTINSIEVNEV